MRVPNRPPPRAPDEVPAALIRHGRQHEGHGEGRRVSHHTQVVRVVLELHLLRDEVHLGSTRQPELLAGVYEPEGGERKRMDSCSRMA